MLGTKPGINFEQPEEASDQQPGADEQNACQSNLGNHETASNPSASGPLARSPAAVLKTFVDIAASHQQSRCNSKEQPGQNRGRYRKGQGLSVDMYGLKHRDADCIGGSQHPSPKNGKKQSQRRATT